MQFELKKDHSCALTCSMKMSYRLDAIDKKKLF